jgi:hypothetical protein
MTFSSDYSSGNRFLQGYSWAQFPGNEGGARWTISGIRRGAGEEPAQQPGGGECRQPTGILLMSVAADDSHRMPLRQLAFQNAFQGL